MVLVSSTLTGHRRPPRELMAKKRIGQELRRKLRLGSPLSDNLLSGGLYAPRLVLGGAFWITIGLKHWSGLHCFLRREMSVEAGGEFTWGRQPLPRLLRVFHPTVPIQLGDFGVSSSIKAGFPLRWKRFFLLLRDILAEPQSCPSTELAK